LVIFRNTLSDSASYSMTLCCDPDAVPFITKRLFEGSNAISEGPVNPLVSLRSGSLDPGA
jgi:hypothetical protein